MWKLPGASSWVVSVAVNVVLSELKRRKLRRWLLAGLTFVSHIATTGIFKA